MNQYKKIRLTTYIFNKFERVFIQKSEGDDYGLINIEIDMQTDDLVGGTVDFFKDHISNYLSKELNTNIENLTYLTSSSTENEIVIYFATQADTPDDRTIAQAEFVDETKFLEHVKNQELVNNYYLAKKIVNEEEDLHMINLAGIIINESDEFLLVRYSNAPDLLQVPKGKLDNSIKGSWEALEKELAKDIFEQTGIEIADGQIPFTDQIIMDKEHFNTLIQYFIAKYKYGKEIIQNSDLISEIKWVHINDLERSEVDEKDYLMLYKAHDFLETLSTN